MKKEKIIRMLVTALGGLAAAVTLALLAYRLWERPPEESAPVQRPYPAPPAATAAPPAATAAPSAETPAPVPEIETLAAEAVATLRQDGVYTVLLVGNDDGNGNTDAIVLGRIDTRNRCMDFVSIPRDTLINSPWEIRKLNAVYWASRNHGGDGITELKRQIARLTGFEPDCYAVVDLDLAAAAIDAIGGVRFDVPFAMDYEDASQDLSIHLQPGEQLLSGEQAMELCRYRSGYVTGDLGRIEMQQRFLKACAGQLIDLGNIPNAARLVSLLSQGLDTDLSGANMAFFLRQLLRCRSEDVRFATAASSPCTVAGYSYAVLELEPWLQQLNERLNPYEAPIGADSLDLVTRRDGRYVGTAELQGAEYYTRGTESSRPLAAEASPAPAEPSLPLPDWAAQAVERDGEGPAVITVTP